jgi:hypothetical protein
VHKRIPFDGRGENARAVKRVKFKLRDKRAALVDLGRHLGMFQDSAGGNGTRLRIILHLGEGGRASLNPRSIRGGRA